MRRIIGVAIAAAVAAGGTANAQVALKPDTPIILRWTPQQQREWYPAIETVYQVHTIKRGAKVRALPVTPRQIEPAWTYAGKGWTVDDYMAAYNVSGLLVIKDGKIILERYGLGRKPQDRWTSFSVAKSVTSTLVGAAIQDGKIRSIDAAVTDYVPELKGSAYDGVTVRQLLMMSSGVRWNEDYSDLKSDIVRVGAPTPEPGNPIVNYLKKLPRAHEPGTTFNYNTAETDLAGILLSRAVGKPLAEYASEKIWRPYGMERDAIWMVDSSGMERGGCCISMTLRDYGRVGQFILDSGKAGRKRVVPDWWVAQATAKQIDNGFGGYGYFWWIRPSGAYEASGIFGQSIATFRDERLIIVMNSAWPQAIGREQNLARTAFHNAIREAARSV